MAAATARRTSDVCIFAFPTLHCARRSIYELGFDQRGYAPDDIGIRPTEPWLEITQS